MHKTVEISIGFAGTNIYKTLIWLYPEEYRKQYGDQIYLLFEDMYKEELEKHGTIKLGFWLSMIIDTLQSITREHFNTMKKQGIKNYLHINKYNITGAILLIPFSLLFLIDLFGRIVQTDLIHYNRATYNFISHTFIYANYFGKPWVLISFAILFPALAIVINLIPLTISLTQFKKLTLTKFVLANPIAIMITIAGLMCLAIIFGHDVIPCIVQGLLYHAGLENIRYLFAFCGKA